MGDLAWGKDVEFFQNVITARIGLVKECFESLLLDLGPVCNKFEYENYYIENPCSFGGGGGTGGDIPSGNNADWISCVERMGLWYGNTFNTYQGQPKGVKAGRRFDAWKPCDLLNGKGVRDDCSGFVCACLWLHGVNVPLTQTAAMQPDKPFGNTLKSAGFTSIPFSTEALTKGDIYVTGGSGHVEINWGPGKQMGWGSPHYHNMPTGWAAFNPNDSHRNYKWIYRKG